MTILPINLYHESGMKVKFNIKELNGYADDCWLYIYKTVNSLNLNNVQGTLDCTENDEEQLPIVRFAPTSYGTSDPTYQPLEDEILGTTHHDGDTINEASENFLIVDHVPKSYGTSEPPYQPLDSEDDVSVDTIVESSKESSNHLEKLPIVDHIPKSYGTSELPYQPLPSHEDSVPDDDDILADPSYQLLSNNEREDVPIFNHVPKSYGTSEPLYEPLGSKDNTWLATSCHIAEQREDMPIVVCVPKSYGTSTSNSPYQSLDNDEEHTPIAPLKVHVSTTGPSCQPAHSHDEDAPITTSCVHKGYGTLGKPLFQTLYEYTHHLVVRRKTSRLNNWLSVVLVILVCIGITSARVDSPGVKGEIARPLSSKPHCSSCKWSELWFSGNVCPIPAVIRCMYYPRNPNGTCPVFKRSSGKATSHCCSAGGGNPVLSTNLASVNGNVRQRSSPSFSEPDNYYSFVSNIVFEIGPLMLVILGHHFIPFRKESQNTTTTVKQEEEQDIQKSLIAQGHLSTHTKRESLTFPAVRYITSPFATSNIHFLKDYQVEGGKQESGGQISDKDELVTIKSCPELLEAYEIPKPNLSHTESGLLSPQIKVFYY